MAGNIIQTLHYRSLCGILSTMDICRFQRSVLSFIVALL